MVQDIVIPSGENSILSILSTQVNSDITVLVFSMEFHSRIKTLCNFVVAMSSCCERPGENIIVHACEPAEAVSSTIDILKRGYWLLKFKTVL